MTHTELHFMIDNYVLLFFAAGSLATLLSLGVLSLLEKWRGEKK